MLRITYSGNIVKIFLPGFSSLTDSDRGVLELVGIGSDSFRIGAVSLDNCRYRGFQAGHQWHAEGSRGQHSHDCRAAISSRRTTGAMASAIATSSPPAWTRSGAGSNDMGIDEYLALNRPLGAEPYIAVNTGFGDAHSAAMVFLVIRPTLATACILNDLACSCRLAIAHLFWDNRNVRAIKKTRFYP